MAKILVVEDDVDLAGRMKVWLETERHVAEVAHDGTIALEHLTSFKYDVVILDRDLPGMSGLEVCKQFRAKGGVTPVIMLTGYDRLADKEAGFDSGVDDYVTKPFQIKELAARIRALMRRPPPSQGPILEVGHVKLNPSMHTLLVNDKEIELQPKEFALLEFFMRHPGQLLSVEVLLKRVWSSETDSTVETVYTSVKRLRRQIDLDKKNSIIKTVYGIGYRMEV